MQNQKHRDLVGYLGRLYGYAFSLCGDPDRAKDLVQDCAAKALAARSVRAALIQAIGGGNVRVLPTRRRRGS